MIGIQAAHILHQHKPNPDCQATICKQHRVSRGSTTHYLQRLAYKLALKLYRFSNQLVHNGLTQLTAQVPAGVNTDSAQA